MVAWGGGLVSVDNDAGVQLKAREAAEVERARGGGVAGEMGALRRVYDDWERRKDRAGSVVVIVRGAATCPSTLPAVLVVPAQAPGLIDIRSSGLVRRQSDPHAVVVQPAVPVRVGPALEGVWPVGWEHSESGRGPQPVVDK